MVETTRRREIEDVASSCSTSTATRGTSVRDIARALDIQGASLYAHVASKEDVLWSIVERAATRFEAAADAARGRRPGGRRRPGRQLSALVRAHVGVVTDDVERASVFVHEWRSLTRDRRAAIAQRRDAYERRFRAVIERRHRGRRLRAGRPGRRRRLHPDRPQRPRRLVPTRTAGCRRAIADAFVDLTLRAVQAPGGPPMTDPLALDPVLPGDRSERPPASTPAPTLLATSPERVRRASRRTSRPAARSRRPTGCPTSTGPPSCASSRCTPTPS